MADVKITALTALGATPANNDLVPIVDVSAGETKKVLISDLLAGVSLSGKTTSDLVEGANLYFTNARVTTVLAGYVVPITLGGTGQSNAQAALNNLTNIGGAAAGDVLTFSGGNAQFLPPVGITPTGDPNTVAYFNPSGDLDSIPNWTLSASPIQSAMNADLTYNPNNLGANPFAQNLSLNIAPLQASPNDSCNVLVLSASLDSTANGFNFGSSGRAVTLLFGSYSYGGNSSTYGSLEYCSFATTIGNGTDPVTIKGATYFNGAFTLAALATIDGPLRGYDFAPNFDVASITTANVSVSGFRDIANMPVAVYGYDGFVTSPLIGSIANAHNYVGFTSNPQITTLTGNAGCFGLTSNPIVTTMGATASVQFASFNPIITTMGAMSNLIGLAVFGNITTGHGNIYGYQFSPNVAGGDANATGAQINMSGIISSGVIKGLAINSPTTSGVNNSAIDSQGFHRLSCDYTISSGQGTVNYNNIGGQIVIPNATTVTGTDVFGNNMAFSINTGDATSDYTPASLVSLTTLGFVGAVTGDGTIHGAINFCLAGYAMSANTGTIDRINNFYAAAVPGGGTATVTESVLFMGDLPGGAFATNHWGIRIEHASLNNYVTNLAIGTANKKVAAPFVLDMVGQSQNKQTVADAGVYGHYVNLTSSTSADASNELFAFSSENTATVAATFTNSKVLFGSAQTLTRGDGSDEGTLEGLCGHESFLKINSGAAGVTTGAYGFLSLVLAQAGTVTDVYHFRSQAIEAGGTITNHYGVYISADATTPVQNWLSGTAVIGGSSYATPAAGNSLEVQSGQLAVVTAGNGLSIKEGANAKMGVATLVAGSATITTTAVTASSRIFVYSQAAGGVIGVTTIASVVAGTSFNIVSSSVADTSTVAWIIVEPA